METVSLQTNRISLKPNKHPGQDVFINITFISSPKETEKEELERQRQRKALEQERKAGNCSPCIITDVHRSVSVPIQFMLTHKDL